MELLGGNRLDPLGGFQRVDLEPQPAPRFFFRGPLTLHLLDLITMAEQLEMLPCREEQDEHEERGDTDRLRELDLPRLVHLADDRVVAHILLDGEFEGLHQAILSATRSLALRARGLRSTSSSRGTIGFFVNTCTSASRCWSARSVCFTIRSSSEGKGRAKSGGLGRRVWARRA